MVSTGRHGIVKVLLLCLFGVWLSIQFRLVWKTSSLITGEVPPITAHSTAAINEARHHQQETAENIKNTNTTAAYSVGCLLVMDDNHRLVEWLAYHHFTMNLRYLVVAVDPRSSTSPEPILQRWKSYGLDYRIWSDDDFMGARVLDKRKRLFELGRKQLTMVHRVRQKAFYQYCLEHLDAVGRNQWTLLLDVDEYLVIRKDNYARDGVDHATTMATPGGVYHFVQEMAQRFKRDKEEQSTTIKNKTGAPSFSLQQFSSPCISIPRILFGTTTTSDFGQRDDNMHPTPSILPQQQLQQQQDRLDTQRWFYHAHYTEFDRNGLAKTILDLRRVAIPKPHFPHPVNPHRPFQDLCRDPKRIVDIHQTALLRVHHYLGTWETYSFRNDSRKGGERSREAWEFRALQAKDGPTTDVVPWLEGFVQLHGADMAARLLEGAGLPNTYTHPPKVNQQWKFQFTQDYFDKSNSQYDSNYGQFLRNRTSSSNGNSMGR